MKITKILLLMFSAAALTSCGVTPQDAAEYNDKIIAQQSAVYDKEIALMNAMKDYTNQDGIKKAHEELISQSGTSIETVKKMDKFDGNTTFADAAVTLFETYKGLAVKEYKELIELYSLSDEEFTEEKEARADELIDAIDNGVTDGINKFKSAQEAFAAKYNIELVQKD